MSCFVPLINIIILCHYNIITIAISHHTYFGESEANEAVERCVQLHSLVKSSKQKCNKVVKIVGKCKVILREREKILGRTFLVVRLHIFDPLERSISNKIDCRQFKGRPKMLLTQYTERNFNIKVHNKYN